MDIVTWPPAPRAHHFSQEKLQPEARGGWRETHGHGMKMVHFRIVLGIIYNIYVYTYLYIHMISIISDHLSCQGSTLGSLGLISFNHPLRWLRERQRHLRASGDGAAAAAAFGCPKKGWVYWRSFTTPQLGVCYANFDMEKTRKKLGYTWIYKLPVCSLGRFKPDQNEANRCQWQSSQKDWVVNISTQGQPFEALQRRQPA